MKKAFVLLLGLMLVGCGNNKVATNQVEEDQKSKYEVVDENNIEDTIEITTDGFVENMDKLFDKLDDYEGKTLTYEGMLVQTEEGKDEYAVVRIYEVEHEDHAHSIYVGLNTTYEGEWPELNSWVKVTGIIERANDGGEDYPVLKIQEMTVMPEQGEMIVVD